MMDDSAMSRLASRQPDDRLGMQRRPVRMSVAALLAVATLVGGSAALASPASATSSSAVAYPGGLCWFPLPLQTAEGTYIRYYTWDTGERVWRRSNWYFVRGLTQYEYTSSGWVPHSAVSFPAGGFGRTVYVYVKTYTASAGWEGGRLGRCINGVKYAGW
jgi:hypothetical protein